MESITTPLIAAALLAAAFVWLCATRVATFAGLMDVPCGRKRHSSAVPLVGGLGMVLAVLALVPLWGRSGNEGWMMALLAVAALAGAVDDRFQLRARTKLIPQTVLAILVVYGAGLRFENLGSILGSAPVLLGEGAGLFTIFAIVGTINTTNMSDGLDGLAGGYVAIALATLLIVAIVGERVEDAGVIAVVLGALAGFLAFNLRTPWRARASVFMGDSGTLALGLVLAWLVITLSNGPKPAMPPVVGALAFALPLYDAMATLLRRLLGRRNPFVADRGHMHYLLKDKGWPTHKVVGTLHLASGAVAAIALYGWHAGWSDQALFLAFVGLFALFLAFVCGAHKACRETGAPYPYPQTPQTIGEEE